jgi:Mg-chelatase subunit ChlD
MAGPAQLCLLADRSAREKNLAPSRSAPPSRRCWTAVTRKRLEVYAALAIGSAALALALGRPSAYGVAPDNGPPVTQAPSSTPATKPAPVVRPRIEVVFALDTTASMSGLIEGAKAKIWGMANRLASGQPRPDIRFGLIAYRDLGDEYVTKQVPMTADLDEVYDHLMGFSAGGGGDGPEHVNQALADAIRKTPWSQDDKVLRLVFLVGDAPAHDDYGDGLNSAALAKEAKAKGIIINTIRCGGDPETERMWTAIAALSGGDFATIAQNGGMVAVTTPYDEELQQLNRELAGTMVGFGSAGDMERAARKAMNRATMAAPAAAEAASFSAKSGAMAKEDLFAAVEGGLAVQSVPDSELPPEMRAMAPAERQKFVDDQLAKRSKLKAKILEASKKRDAYLKHAEKDNKVEDAFDGKVFDAVKEQARKIDVAY